MADINPKKPDTTKISGIIAGQGGGKAYESVAQSAALAIQDATDHLRNINTISATALAIALAQSLNQTSEGIKELNSSITMIKELANSPDFKVIG